LRPIRYRRFSKAWGCYPGPSGMRFPRPNIHGAPASIDDGLSLTGESGSRRHGSSRPRDRRAQPDRAPLESRRGGPRARDRRSHADRAAFESRPDDSCRWRRTIAVARCRSGRAGIPRKPSRPIGTRRPRRGPRDWPRIGRRPAPAWSSWSSSRPGCKCPQDGPRTAADRTFDGDRGAARAMARDGPNPHGRNLPPWACYTASRPLPRAGWRPEGRRHPGASLFLFSSQLKGSEEGVERDVRNPIARIVPFPVRFHADQ
jgi:hypothetical protein